MHIDFKDLALFINIAESASLTQAAKRSFISPAAASVRIKALEAQLNAHLLYRDSRGVELTDAGNRLLKHARLIMQQLAYLKTEFTEYGADASGHIRIFANTTAVSEFLPEVLAGFLAQNPGVSIDLQERHSPEIVRGVLEGSTDMGIIAGPVTVEDLEVIHFSTDRLVVVVPKGHALDGQSCLKLLDTLGHPHVGLQPGSTLHEFMREQAIRVGKSINWRIQVASFESVCRMVETGVGIGVIPESAARRHQKTMNLSVLMLDEPWAVRERSILVRQFDALPGCVKSLINLIQPRHMSST
ncbi:LysR substrate-binding domain-containing protein [Pseudomonas sp. BGr12]|uniref:LysR substrate-binding domain-containing protein n=1 Tax=Pseudomonas sp. BGr12 TaxID=2936269 RepID=UPI002559DF65|nr:LysR substrate-binding domain-containing protein [Pseudomonas sp. BJa5]MDL2428397.1 LysR substrate-binding domain-containing protein [Pseudomonas sp. BJa5]